MIELSRVEIMKIGMPTLTELSDILDNIKLCSELNLDFLEINLSLPFEFTDSLIFEANRLTDKYGIELTFHLPENLDIAQTEPIIRTAYLKYFDTIIELSKKLNVKLINMHLPCLYHQ